MRVKVLNHGGYKQETLEGKQEECFNLLVKTKELLAGKKWWLSAGTLLGIYRDNKFIPYDTDIDIGMIGDEHTLPPEFKLIRSVVDEDGRRHQSAYIYEPSNIIYDILHYWEEEDGTYFTTSEKGTLYRDPEMFKLGKLVFREESFPVPLETEEYIKKWYPNWETPIINYKTRWSKTKN